MGSVSAGVGGWGGEGVVVCGQRGKGGSHVGEVFEAFYRGEDGGVAG